MAAASRTAEYMALFRALESARPERERLFDDPLAREFLLGRLRHVPALAAGHWSGYIARTWLDRRWPGARASGVARTRLIDEYLRRALDDGIDQIVLLGAGFDSRAYRIDGIRAAAVFEVDLPQTLARKRAIVASSLDSPADHVRFVELDLDRAKLDEALRDAGLRRDRRSFFIWEGVSHYLTEPGVDATLRSVRAAGAPASRLVFTYVDRALLDDPRRFADGPAILAKVRESGEPWTFGLDPERVADYLAEHELRLLEDFGSLEYRARFMPPHGRHMRGYEFYRVAVAEL
jgi:methyltransferase (TIGR00027 family)